MPFHSPSPFRSCAVRAPFHQGVETVPDAVLGDDASDTQAHAADIRPTFGATS